MRKRILILTLLCMMLSIPAQALSVVCDGEPLPEDASYLENGTTWVALRSFANAYRLPISWDGQSAWLDDVCITPGARYLLKNDRCFYSQTVRLEEGVTWVPVRAAAAAIGADVVWDSTQKQVRLGAPSVLLAAKDVYDAEDLDWLSRIIEAEAGSESLDGKIAVGNVILSRVASEQFPDTIYSVIFDTAFGTQFTPVSNGTIFNTPSEESIIAAKLCLEGAIVVKDCLYFQDPKQAKSTWITENRHAVASIGNHVFYS